MFYRIVIIANLPRRPSTRQVTRVIDHLRTHAINVNVGSPNPELTRARIEECHHDETPTESCTLIRAWELPINGD